MQWCHVGNSNASYITLLDSLWSLLSINRTINGYFRLFLPVQKQYADDLSETDSDSGSDDDDEEEEAERELSPCCCCCWKWQWGRRRECRRSLSRTSFFSAWSAAAPICQTRLYDQRGKITRKETTREPRTVLRHSQFVRKPSTVIIFCLISDLAVSMYSTNDHS